MRWAQTPRSATASCVADSGHLRPVGLTPKTPAGYRSNLLLTCTSAVLVCVSGCAVTRLDVSDSQRCETGTSAECGPSNNGRRAGICKNDREELTACQIATACDVPRELRKVTLPDYRIEIPDILLIQAVHNLRPPHAIIHAGEPLLVQANRGVPLLPTENPVSRQFKQINGLYVIGTDGYLNLGPEYGKVLVAEEPLNEIQRRVEVHLKRIAPQIQVLVTLPNPANEQIVAGQHLVRMDGTVGLGIYGGVYINGMTRKEARDAIQQHLAQHIHDPRVTVDVLAYNSKKYYVVIDGGGAGEGVVTLPSTGNETVLDAIASIQGLPSVASKADIWVARPAPGCCKDQVLPVKWNAIVQGAQTETNYQVLPGDRIYVKADKMVALDTAVSRITAPFERLLGFTILGNGTYQTLQVGRAAFIAGGGP